MAHAADHAHDRPARMSWAHLLKRIIDMDIERCSNCGARLKIIATIEEPPVMVRIFAHPGLPTRAAPRALAQRLDLFQAA